MKHFAILIFTFFFFPVLLFGQSLLRDKESFNRNEEHFFIRVALTQNQMIEPQSDARIATYGTLGGGIVLPVLESEVMFNPGLMFSVKGNRHNLPFRQQFAFFAEMPLDFSFPIINTFNLHLGIQPSIFLYQPDPHFYQSGRSDIDEFGVTGVSTYEDQPFWDVSARAAISLPVGRFVDVHFGYSHSVFPYFVDDVPADDPTTKRVTHSVFELGMNLRIIPLEGGGFREMANIIKRDKSLKYQVKNIEENAIFVKLPYTQDYLAELDRLNLSKQKPIYLEKVATFEKELAEAFENVYDFSKVYFYKADNQPYVINQRWDKAELLGTDLAPIDTTEIAQIDEKIKQVITLNGDMFFHDDDLSIPLYNQRNRRIKMNAYEGDIQEIMEEMSFSRKDLREDTFLYVHFLNKLFNRLADK